GSLVENGVSAIDVRCISSRFTHKDKSGGKVPGRQIALPEAVKAASGEPGKVERCRAGAADARDLLLHDRQFAAEPCEIAAPAVRNAAADHAIVEIAARRDAQAAVVQERALAALGDIELVGHRIE